MSKASMNILFEDPKRVFRTSDPDYFRWTQWIFLQMFNSAGVPTGDEIRLATTDTGEHLLPSVAMDDAGNVGVAWNGSSSSDTDGVLLARYQFDGSQIGGIELVNTTTDDQQDHPEISMAGDGSFV